jgi:putative hydrolase of the HAD superfamily
MAEGVIFWDFDGTLGFRKNGGFSVAMVEALDESLPGHGLRREMFSPVLRRGFPWHQPQISHLYWNTAELWWENLEPVFAKAFEQAGIPAIQARNLAKRVRGAYTAPERWGLYEDTLPVLKYLKDWGWAMALVSNHVPELADIIDHLGLRPYLAGVFNSAIIGYEKPHPKIYETAFRAMGQPHTVWFIGDNPEADVLGPEQVGIPGILVRSRDPRAMRQAESLNGIFPWLQHDPVEVAGE